MDSVIDGDRVRLRLWEDTDQPRSLTCSNGRGEAFGDWLPGVTKDLANIPAFIRHVTDEFLNQSAFFYAIEGEGEPVGQVSLRLRPPASGEVGYWVCTDRTRSRFATRGVIAVCEAAFRDGLEELVIHCDEGNSPSASVARKAGLTHVRTDDLDSSLPRTQAQTGREMTWVRPARRN